MKSLIETLLKQALAALPETLVPAAQRDIAIEVERTRDAAHGDFAANAAMRLAKAARQNPRKIAEALEAALPAHPAVAKVEIAGAGFINFFLDESCHHAEIGRILELGKAYGRSDLGRGRTVLVEFVSANPTGPLHVGHGRHAAYGASVANLLDAAGFRASREYYVNDAGRQMDILAASTWLRYLEHCGERFEFPANGYRGDYLIAIAAELHAAEGGALVRKPAEIFSGLPPDAPRGGDQDEYIDALIARARELLGAAAFRRVLDHALGAILGDIREDLEEFGVRFDSWFSERSLLDDGSIDRALAGRERGFEHLLYVWGADHHGYIARLRAGLTALGGPPECFEVRLVQFVTLFRGGEKAQMSTRSGEFVTLRALREEVGNDAARLFYIMRSNDQHLDFDLELAKARSNDNPVYYIQYAHARVASVERQMRERGIVHDAARGAGAFAKLTEPQEIKLLKRLSGYPETVEYCALERAPHALVHYLRDLANDFHTYYGAHQFLVEDEALRDARVSLALAAQTVIRNGLGLLGVSAPETM